MKSLFICHSKNANPILRLLDKEKFIQALYEERQQLGGSEFPNDVKQAIDNFNWNLPFILTDDMHKTRWDILEKYQAYLTGKTSERGFYFGELISVYVDKIYMYQRYDFSNWDELSSKDQQLDKLMAPLKEIRKLLTRANFRFPYNESALMKVLESIAEVNINEISKLAPTDDPYIQFNLVQRLNLINENIEEILAVDMCQKLGRRSCQLMLDYSSKAFNTALECGNQALNASKQLLNSFKAQPKPMVKVGRPRLGQIVS